ncbi:hypothetical protein [Virgibacillus dokdonensis]|uniref:Uncharacterized protein n=1 Tax=Virgibacillus dokdonensis TaxID=302167 RepID=A0A2K9IVE2_9BACI|nr:hypothetical protein [Virgibacillus dokdonensis]AUJ23758.1 hypothetical protein A21D_00645 [Virgibacillus dokdonensis]
MKGKFKSLAIGTTLATALVLGLSSPAHAQVNASPQVQSTSPTSDVTPFAYPTRIGMKAPSTIYGMNATTTIRLSFSGDRAGGKYRYYLNAGNGNKRNGSTAATTVAFPESYYLGSKDYAVYSLFASVTGYSHDSTSRTMRHYR